MKQSRLKEIKEMTTIDLVGMAYPFLCEIEERENNKSTNPKFIINTYLGTWTFSATPTKDNK